MKSLDNEQLSGTNEVQSPSVHCIYCFFYYYYYYLRSIRFHVDLFIIGVIHTELVVVLLLLVFFLYVL